MIENQNQPMPPQGPSQKLIDMVGDGFVPISGSLQLEKAYFEYQTSLSRRVEHESGAKLLSLEELPDRETQQIDRILDNLVGIGVPVDLLAQRRNRIRIHWVDSHSTSEYGEVGGEFDSQTGIASVTRNTDIALQNHLLLHEITHGFLASGSLFEKAGNIISTGNGLHEARTVSGYRPTAEQLETLRQFNEGIVDSMSLAASDLDAEKYLSENDGYSRNVKALLHMSANSPTVLHEAILAAAVDGVQSQEQAHRFCTTLTESALAVVSR